MSDFRPTDDQVMLREGFRDLLDGIMTERRSREALDGPSFSAEAWHEIGSGGWLEVAAHNGAGSDLGTALTLCLLAEEAGAHFVPVPFTLTATVVVPLLTATADPPVDPREVISGNCVVSIALPDAGNPATPEWNAVKATRHAEGALDLSGRLDGVLFGAVADWVLIPLTRPDGSVAVVALDRTRPGVDTDVVDELDFAKPTATLTFDRVRVEPHEVLGGSAMDRAAELRELLWQYLLCLSGESVGAADEAVRRTVRYVNERRQFGVPVGSFQAVKHLLADAYGETELARGLAHHVAWRRDRDGAWPLSDLFSSRLLTGEMYPRTLERCIQCHGGAGFTWEQGLHGWYRQALFYRHHPFTLGTLRRVLWERLTAPASEREAV